MILLTVIKLTTLWDRKDEIPPVGTSPGKLHSVIFTVRKRSCGKGNIFTSVCQEFYPGGVSEHVLGQTPPWADQPPAQQMATAADGMHPTGMHSCNVHYSSMHSNRMHTSRLLTISHSILGGVYP